MPIFGVIGGIVGRDQAHGKEKQAERALERAYRAIRRVKVPTIEQQMVELLGPEYVGDLTPEMLQAIGIGPSEMENISLDPRLKQAQMSALEQLAGLSEGGLSLSDLAMIQQGQRAASSQNQAAQEQILQEMQQRGIGGSGAELAARLSASQESADRLGAGSLDIIRAAQERALQAMSQYGNLANQIRSQDYSMESDRARAIDTINQFNIQNQQQVQQQNIAARNMAASRNLAEKQRIADQQKAIQNQQEIQNKALYQQRFQNQLAKAKGMQTPLINQGLFYQNQAARIAEHHAKQGQAVDKGIMDIFGMVYGVPKKPTEGESNNGQ